jgi:hypothetical protein
MKKKIIPETAPAHKASNSNLQVILGALVLSAFLLVTLPFFNSSGATDAENFNHWVKTNFRFGDSALDNSVLSPFQGMGGLAQPLAVRIHLPYLAAYLLSPGHMEGIVTIVSAFLLAVAVFYLCRTMGAGVLCSIVAGQIAAVFFFPPLWLFLLPWSHFMTTELFSYLPAFAFPAALGVLFLALFLKLGEGTRNSNILITIGLVAVFIYSTITDPLYTAMFWIPIGFFCIGILCGSENKAVFLWRLGGGFAAFLICLFAGIFHFYYALFKNAARTVFPNELYVEIQTWDKFTGMFSHGGWSLLFSLGLVASCVYLAIKRKGSLRGLVVSVFAYFAGMVVLSLVYVYSGIRWNLPLPVYLEVAAAPVYLCCICLSAGELIANLPKKKKANFSNGWVKTISTVCAVPVLALVTYQGFISSNPNILDKANTLANKESGGIVSQALVPNLSIQSDGRFRGSVATLTCIPGGQIMRKAGISDDAPFTKENINFLLRYLRTYDPMLYMTGLWEMNIPTLEENNHLVTPPFYYLFSRNLSRPQDFQSRNWTLCTKANPNLMAALGTRMIVADQPIDGPQVKKVYEQTNQDGIPLSVYELSDPNTGNYSPTKLVRSDKAEEIIAEMAKDDFPFKKTAIVSHNEKLPELTQAEYGELFFDRGGFRVRGASKGWSLLILPVQFSNSLKVMEVQGDFPSDVRLVRVNLLQTGVLFRGTIHAKISHRFGPFRGIWGRLKDIEDWQSLGIKEDGRVPYPPNYQPNAFGG